MNTDVKLVSIDTTNELNEVYLFNPNNYPFRIKGIFREWSNPHNTPNEVILSLEDYGNDYYHLSLCNFCKKDRILQIHIEKLKNSDPSANTKLIYKNAKKEHFNLKSFDPIYVSRIDVLIYNTDETDPEYKYLKCGKEEGDLTFPPNKDKDNNFHGPHPNVKKGNIIIGNP